MAKKTLLTYKEIEERLRQLRDGQKPTSEIGYTLLWAFGKSEREIERYKEGKDVIKTFDGLLIKGLWCYKASSTLRFADELDRLKADPQVIKSAPKIIAVSDGITIRAYDTREKNTFEQQVNRLYCDFDFFYPLAGVERVQYTEESPADIKAAEKLAKLHDEIRAFNEFSSDSDLHDLNTFIARLLFCFFAEDTGIFPSGAFTNAIKRFTYDARNLRDILEQMFRFMGGRSLPSGEMLTYCQQNFGVVGGGLFQRDIYIPQLSNRARNIIIDSGDLDWQDINPDIFGSMIQAVVNPDERANQGMHYTSVPNIMKVINPLFMDDLREQYQGIAKEFDDIKKQRDMGTLTSNQFLEQCKPIDKKCRQLLLRMSKMKFFDPACGSGNFLIITYKMLRLLEMDILAICTKCTPQSALQFIDGSCITLSQFYGIELLDFPHEVAMLSLWLAEHQMNKKMHEDFGVNTNALPLKDICNIHCGNACRLDWNVICPHTKSEEVFVFGNPPYLGASWQDKNQKLDLDNVFRGFKSYKNLDYIACWFLLGKNYIENTLASVAFVSTNSICQGESVSMLWKPLLKDNVYIAFAHHSFKWKNNAKHNAGVTCVIVGLCSLTKKNPTIYEGDNSRTVEHINGYLMSAHDISIGRLSKSISDFPDICKGSMPRDGGFLILENEEATHLLQMYPTVKNIIKPYIGASEFLKSTHRYCLWATKEEFQNLENIDDINKRYNQVSDFRRNSDAGSTKIYADRPYLFVQRTYKNEDFVCIPEVTSERREYVPIGLIDAGTVVSNKAFAIYGGGPYMLGILSSKIHKIWFQTFGGRLETRYSYSSNMCYNSFPFPKISTAKKAEIEEAATDILLTREPYLTMGKTLADLYDPDTMPADLLAAHKRLDDIVESCYPGYPFASDEARLECLFKLYEKMTAKK